MRWLRYIIVPNNTNNNELAIVPALNGMRFCEKSMFDTLSKSSCNLGEVNRVIVNVYYEFHAWKMFLKAAIFEIKIYRC